MGAAIFFCYICIAIHRKLPVPNATHSPRISNYDMKYFIYLLNHILQTLCALRGQFVSRQSLCLVPLTVLSFPVPQSTTGSLFPNR